MTAQKQPLRERATNPSARTRDHDVEGGNRLHRRDSNTQRFASSHRTVRTMPSFIVRRGVQPVFRILVVSRKMNGLSPTHPREPPAYSSRGVTVRASQISRMLSFT